MDYDKNVIVQDGRVYSIFERDDSIILVHVIDDSTGVRYNLTTVRKNQAPFIRENVHLGTILSFVGEIEDVVDNNIEINADKIFIKEEHRS